MDHTISTDELKDYIHEVQLAYHGGRDLTAQINFYSGEIVYKVKQRGDETHKTCQTLEEAIKSYNDLG